MSLRKKKNYLHLIDMAKNKTVLRMIGFACGESEITFASQCILTTLPLGEEAVGYRLSRQTDRLKSFLSSHEVSVGQLFLVLHYMTGQDRSF